MALRCRYNAVDSYHAKMPLLAEARCCQADGDAGRVTRTRGQARDRTVRRAKLPAACTVMRRWLRPRRPRVPTVRPAGAEYRTLRGGVAVDDPPQSCRRKRPLPMYRCAGAARCGRRGGARARCLSPFTPFRPVKRCFSPTHCAAAPGMIDNGDTRRRRRIWFAVCPVVSSPTTQQTA